MAMQLDRVVPFGRSLDEYTKLFNLTESDLQKKILSVADGPASFNAEGTAKGYQIQSIDPLYCFSAKEIQDQFYAVVDDVIDQVKRSAKDWIWSYHQSPQDLRQNRERALQLFSQDYEQGKAEGRYEIGELPHLRYADLEYELGLCSHFLFLYSDHFNQELHLQSIQELLRVCTEVRIFPLLTLNLERSPYLPLVLDTLDYQGYNCQIQTVEYQLQRGGNQMLKITRKSK
ncbi:SAM-dependent methyltransferase [Roseofilum reptotaenium CS-1145]|uniref:SAM-dependent methyltransferase n=1 Tax=Roseofilum reptotaenium AO1-A TaxID=1925591 RepID=A0A1L9QMT7_9CYAN|nr:SAM-dependent methyltransferase [Roseofilum reptotaenium]MDB9517207.1 SAM-dependent methyltransferase [Roseofilum reptotaenium CS-1145]OJJ22753.1 SAM-dependent methyltransferase [Roseofilum reptotaenium AO1-A]